MLQDASGRRDRDPSPLPAIHHLRKSHLREPVRWNILDMRRLTSWSSLLIDHYIGEPSPLSSPLGPLSESPESESGFQKLSLQTEQPLRSSVDSLSSSGYEPLSRWASDYYLTLLGVGHL